MASGNFDRALAATLRWEGGYADHPADPGGATNIGITHKVLADWRGVESVTKAEVKALTLEEASSIYRAKFWDVVRGDELPAGVDLAVFDFAVNSGPTRAGRYLQGIVGVERDGVIGSKTVEAVKGDDATRIVRKLCDDRLAFVKGLATWPTFGKGWHKRITDIRAASIKMVEAATPKPSEPAAPAKPWWQRLIDSLLSALMKGRTS